MSKSGPYTNHTLQTFLEMGRAARAVAFSVERLDCPAIVADKVKRLRAVCKSLIWELTVDYAAQINRRITRAVTVTALPVVRLAWIVAVACATGAALVMGLGI